MTNHGPNVATDVIVLDELPPEATLVSAGPSCTEDPAGLVCDLGELASGAPVDLEIVVDVPPALVFDAGGPVTIANTASVTFDHRGSKPERQHRRGDSTVVAVADLELVSVDVLDVPAEALIGEDLPVTVRSFMRNLGPSWPIDAELGTVATASAGASAAPTSQVTPVDALSLNTLRPVEQPFTMRCEEPGLKQVVFDVEIRPANAEDTDFLLGNNVGQVVAIVECVVPIAINIRPGNPHNPCSRRTARGSSPSPV